MSSLFYLCPKIYKNIIAMWFYTHDQIFEQGF